MSLPRRLSLGPAARGARAAAERERHRIELLMAAADITDGAADIEAALRRLADLLVPDFADATWIDVLDAGGLRRVATRFDGPDRDEMEAWLMARGRTDRVEHSPTTRALRGQGSQLAELVGELRERMVHDERDREMLDQSGLRSTLSIPLAPRGEILGAIGMGLGRSGRSYGPEELAFAELLVGRAALALANAQLVARLQATQRRLDGILGTLVEAVTVHDAHGRVVFANPAAADLLGLPDVEAVVTTPPEEYFDRFEMRDAQGRPVFPEELPGARVIRGERPEPLLTHTTDRYTGRSLWLRTKAAPLRDETGSTLAVNVIEDLTEEQEAFAELARQAHTLQASLLPDALPEVPGWEIAADYRPGELGAQVGGDFYDVFAVEGGHMVLLGDVTGKGVAAAAVTALVRHTARTAAFFEPRPGAVLELVNRTLLERPQRAPVTMLCVLLHADAITIASAGHPLPLRGGDELGETGLLLGAAEQYPTPREVRVPVAPGETLLLYTDGVTDTPGEHDRFGEGRLRAAVAGAPPEPAALLEAVIEALESFARGTVADDRAMLGLRRRAAAERR